MKHKLSFFAVLLMALAIPQSVKAYDFSKAYQGQMLYYTVIDSVNHYVMLTCPKDTLLTNGNWNGESLWNIDDKPLGALVLPDTVSHNGITYTVRAIGDNTFRSCPIYSVVMSNTIDSLVGGCFFNCTYLTNVTFSNSLRYIGGACFAGAYLGDVVLPPSVRILKETAFINSHITSIVLNDSLEVMESLCLSGNQITSFYIPASVKSINNPLGNNYNGFSGFNTSIVVDPNNPYYDSRNNCNAIIESLTGNMIAACRNTTFPEGIISFDTWLFGGFSLDTLVLPSTLRRMNCGNYDPVHIKHLVINSPSMFLKLRNAWGHFELYVDTIHVLPDTPPFLFLESNPEESFFSHTVVIVPCNSSPAYQAANGWSNFTNYIEEGMHNVTAMQAEHGTVTVARPTCANPSATFTATADEGYHFAQWSDGDTNNPRIVPIVSDTTLTATFAINQYTVTAIPNDTEMGDVIGSGMCDHGSTITLSATANSSYHFDHWSDNITENPRPLTVTCDTTVTAFFVALPVDTIYVHDTTIITDTVIFRYYMYDTTIVNNYQYDTSIYNHFQFDTTLVFDTIIINIYNFDTSIYNTYQYDTTIVNYYYYDTVYVNSYTHDTVNNYFYDTINNYYYDTVVITNTYHDTVFVNNYIFDTIYLNRYIFDTIYIHDTVFVPSGQEGIGDVDAIDAKIYQRDGQIVVEGAENNMVWLYDVNGRVMATRQDDYSAIHFDVPASGTYLIKIGNHPARRVVVIK